MKRLIFQVYIPIEGKNPLYDFCMPSVKVYADRVGADYKVLREMKMKIPVNMNRTGRNKKGLISKAGNCLPIMEKSVALEYFPEYDQILIVDADIAIKDTAPDIFEELTPEYHFGGVLERDAPLTPGHKNKIKGYSNDMFKRAPCNSVQWDWNDCGADFMNMGLMLFNKSFMELLEGDSPREFLMRDEFADFRDGIGLFKYSTDQVMYNYFLKKSKANVKHLDWKWNALHRGARPERMNEAYFVHFFLQKQMGSNAHNMNHLKGIVGKNSWIELVE